MTRNQILKDCEQLDIAGGPIYVQKDLIDKVKKYTWYRTKRSGVWTTLYLPFVPGTHTNLDEIPRSNRAGDTPYKAIKLQLSLKQFLFNLTSNVKVHVRQTWPDVFHLKTMTLLPSKPFKIRGTDYTPRYRGVHVTFEGATPVYVYALVEGDQKTIEEHPRRVTARGDKIREELYSLEFNLAHVYDAEVYKRFGTAAPANFLSTLGL